MRRGLRKEVWGADKNSAPKAKGDGLQEDTMTCGTWGGDRHSVAMLV